MLKKQVQALIYILKFLWGEGGTYEKGWKQLISSKEASEQPRSSLD